MTKKVPIFIIAGKSPLRASGGGYPAYSRNLAKVLVTLGYKVYILSLSKKEETIDTKFGTLLYLKASILNINMTALPGLPLYSWMFSRKIKQVLNEKNIDNFIVWGIGPWGYAGHLLKKDLGNRIIHLNHYFTTIKHEWGRSLKALRVQDYGIILKLKFLFIYYTLVKYLSSLEEKVLKSADVIITNYKSTEQIIKQQFNTPSKKFYKAAFTVEIYSRKEVEIHQKQYYKLPKKFLFFMSRHDPRKGVNFLLHAIKILVERRKAIPLLIAGTGEIFESNKKLAKKLDIENWVKFIGFVKNPELIFKKTYAFCFPTVEEGAGALIINEAMAMGVPIVCTACDGIVEDIKHKKTGLLVPMYNSEAFANALEELIQNPKHAAFLGKNAKAEFKKRFSFKNMKNDIKKLLLIVENQ